MPNLTGPKLTLRINMLLWAAQDLEVGFDALGWGCACKIRPPAFWLGILEVLLLGAWTRSRASSIRLDQLQGYASVRYAVRSTAFKQEHMIHL